MPTLENSGFTTETAVVTIADGANVVEGATADAANTTGTTGTVSGKLRGIVQLLAGILQVGGNVASGVADAGNPIKFGGVAGSSTPAAVTAGQRRDVWVGLNGQVIIGAQSSNLGDGASATEAVWIDANGTNRRMATNIAGFNGATWDRLRTPTTFKTVTATASGDTALWTPTTGKKFRLMGYVIYVTANVTIAGGGLVEVLLRDATTGLAFGYSFFAPAAALTTFAPSGDSGVVPLGNGYLSALANNVLNVNLSAALASGEVRVVAFGTEE